MTLESGEKFTNAMSQFCVHLSGTFRRKNNNNNNNINKQSMENSFSKKKNVKK